MQRYKSIQARLEKIRERLANGANLTDALDDEIMRLEDEAEEIWDELYGDGL